MSDTLLLLLFLLAYAVQTISVLVSADVLSDLLPFCLAANQILFHTLDGVHASQLDTAAPANGSKANSKKRSRKSKPGTLYSSVPGAGAIVRRGKRAQDTVKRQLCAPAVIHGQGLDAKPVFEELVRKIEATGFLDRDDLA